jgi:hypothetical protein
MTYKIELYKGPGQEFFGTMPLMPVIQESLEKQLGREINRASIMITIVQVPEDIMIDGTPVVENLLPEFGYTYVMLAIDKKVVYRHPHPLSDILTQTLQTKLREQYPEVKEWKFRVDIPGMPPVSYSRATPSVQGAVPVRPFAPGKKPGFTIRRIQEPEPQAKKLSDFGVVPNDKERRAKVKILLPPSLKQDFYNRRLSDKVEEGGFLVGKVHGDAEAEGTYLLEINGAPTAQYTGASFFHFTFTGDSFAGIKRTLKQERPEERLLGWFHTHLFPATPELGLTSIDLVLHFGTFTIPWQTAGLINLDSPDGKERTLRFYVREGNTMVLCPWFEVKENGD